MSFYLIRKFVSWESRSAFTQQSREAYDNEAAQFYSAASLGKQTQLLDADLRFRVPRYHDLVDPHTIRT